MMEKQKQLIERDQKEEKLKLKQENTTQKHNKNQHLDCNHSFWNP